MALEEGSGANNDVATWLKRHNLEPLIQVFTERAIALDELQEIAEGDEELQSFAQELSNDANIQQRLIKAAKQLYLSAAQNAHNRGSFQCSSELGRWMGSNRALC